MRLFRRFRRRPGEGRDLRSQGRDGSQRDPGLRRGDDKTLLRFLVCGSVDDGKSSLLGRLLYETGSAYEDELAQCGGDLSRLVDGLEAEREQGITIDVAWRFFETERRKFIVADAPGHEQYTRNLVTGASTAELALVLVDAQSGILTQTRRHAFLCGLLGVRRLLLVVNKMDLVGYDRSVFERIADEFRAVADDVLAIPVSATEGDNVTRRSEAMAWYGAPTLLEHLEAVEPQSADSDGPFWLPVQAAVREPGFRGAAGLIVSGTVRPRDPVWILPSATETRVERVLVAGSEAKSACSGQSVTLTFASDVDCSRGDLVSSFGYGMPEVADQFEAVIVWMGSEELVPGRQYGLKLATQSCLATLQPPKHEIDMATLEPAPAKTLALNGIGVCDLWTDKPLVFAPYEQNRDLGGFILIDRVTNDTVGAGLIRYALRRSQNIHAQPLEVTREARAAMKDQRPRLLWFTGLSGAGKSTIANLVEAKLHARGRHTFMLDGDNVRLGLTRDLGFSDADRAENIRRVAETAKLMLDAGLVVLAAFISPFRAERRMVREMLPEGEFVEIFVDVPLEEAERRDPKGLYVKARDGRIPNFTGIGSPYEAPEQAEIRIDTTAMSAEAAADEVVKYLEERR